MASGKKSWFARHCAAPPPLNDNPVCPCATCYNVGTHAVTHAAPPQATALRYPAADTMSLASSASTVTFTSTSHVEHAKN